MLLRLRELVANLQEGFLDDAVFGSKRVVTRLSGHQQRLLGIGIGIVEQTTAHGHLPRDSSHSSGAKRPAADVCAEDVNGAWTAA